LDGAAAAPVSRPDAGGPRSLRRTAYGRRASLRTRRGSRFDNAAYAQWEDGMKYGVLWLLGVPIPVLIVLYLLFH
jgi:hypothetical protein